MLAVVALSVYALDQLTKIAAVALLTPNEIVPVLGDAFQLRLIRNPGAAFSLGTGSTWILTCFAAIVVIAILRVARRLGSRAWAVALGLLLAGATGNLTDRLVRSPGFARGHVVDFFELPRWPIFNIADASICVAAVLVVVLAVRGIDLDGSRTGSRSTTPASSEADPDAPPSQEHPTITSTAAPATPTTTPVTEADRRG